MITTSCYEQLSTKNLVDLYLFLLNNIYCGVLSDAMFIEIDLLESLALNRGISLSYFSRRTHSEKSAQLLILIK